MAFFEVPRGQASGLTMSVSDRKKGGRAVRLGIPISALEEAGFKDGAVCACVKFGFGRDTGKIQIIPCGIQRKEDSWYTLSGSSKKQQSINLSCTKIGIDFLAASSTPLEYKVKGGIIVAEIPEEIMEGHELNSAGRLREHKAEEMDRLNAAKEG